jgi:uracil-DNA glycosylase family 4
MSPDSLEALAAEVESCTRCPRLVAWRMAAASDPPRRYRGQRYWARPLTGFGDPAGRLLIVGLAPAAHGGNRTGRIFTGDRSGDWLFAALHRVGYANKPTSEHRGDGLRLTDAYVAAAVRCPPPANRPTTDERNNCLPFLVRELRLLSHVRVVIALGSFAWNAALLTLRELGISPPRPKPRFSHGAEVPMGPYVLMGCFHPSQQNTFTGKLTLEMTDAVLARARLLSRQAPGRTPATPRRALAARSASDTLAER